MTAFHTYQNSNISNPTLDVNASKIERVNNTKFLSLTTNDIFYATLYKSYHNLNAFQHLIKCYYTEIHYKLSHGICIWSSSARAQDITLRKHIIRSITGM